MKKKSFGAENMPLPFRKIWRGTGHWLWELGNTYSGDDESKVAMHRTRTFTYFSFVFHNFESVWNSPESESAVLQSNHFNNRVIKSALNPLSGRSRRRQHSVPFCWRSENGLREQLNVISTAYTIDKEDKYHATAMSLRYWPDLYIFANKELTTERRKTQKMLQWSETTLVQEHHEIFSFNKTRFRKRCTVTMGVHGTFKWDSAICNGIHPSLNKTSFSSPGRQRMRDAPN